MRSRDSLNVVSHNEELVGAVVYLLEHRLSLDSLDAYLPPSLRERLRRLRASLHDGEASAVAPGEICPCRQCLYRDAGRNSTRASRETRA